MLCIQLVIDFSDDLKAIRFVWHTIGNEAACRIIRLWQFLHEVQRHWIRIRWSDTNSREWATEGSRLAAHGRSHRCGKVALQHRWRWHEGLGVRRIGTLCRSLISAEEKQFVPNNPATPGSTKLVSLECALYFSVLHWIEPCKILRRIQQVVTDELEQTAVKFIRAGLGYRIHLRA